MLLIRAFLRRDNPSPHKVPSGRRSLADPPLIKGNPVLPGMEQRGLGKSEAVGTGRLGNRRCDWTCRRCRRRRHADGWCGGCRHIRRHIICRGKIGICCIGFNQIKRGAPILKVQDRSLKLGGICGINSIAGVHNIRKILICSGQGLSVISTQILGLSYTASVWQQNHRCPVARQQPDSCKPFPAVLQKCCDFLHGVCP